VPILAEQRPARAGGARSVSLQGVAAVANQLGVAAISSIAPSGPLAGSSTSTTPTATATATANRANVYASRKQRVQYKIDAFGQLIDLAFVLFV
jgi:hypothetical protein